MSDERDEIILGKDYNKAILQVELEASENDIDEAIASGDFPRFDVNMCPEDDTSESFEIRI